jgi:hypothetical protein
MMNARKLNIVLALIALTFCFSFGVKAQEDCVYGFKIYARDKAGKAVENGKIKVSTLSETDKLPSNVTSYVEKSGVYNVHGYGGTTVKGDFVLNVSAEGYEAYERKFNFPVCEMQSFELRLRAVGSTEKASFERLFNVHGKVYDEEMKPFGNAKVEAKSAEGRVYQTSSNAYGFYEIDLPKGVATIRVTNSKIPDVVFKDFKIEKNYSVLNVPVCLKCKQAESKN